MQASINFINHIPFKYGKLRRFVGFCILALHYMTFRKIINFFKCEREKFRRKSKPASRPYIAIIDTTNICNLNCPYCPTGARRESRRPTGPIDLCFIDALLEEMGSYLISANLFNWGEPLLNPRLAEIVALFHKHRVMTSISSNMSVGNKKILSNLCEAGLDHLMVSLSGADQNVYEKYHRAGRLDVVLENLDHLLTCRKKYPSSALIVEMKYLLFRHNQHQVEQARQLARNLGVDIFRVEKAGGPVEYLVEERTNPRDGIETVLCHQLWQTIVINSDGGIPPCCYTYFKEDDFAEAGSIPLRQLRNNERFVIARQFFNPRAKASLPQRLKHPCLKCHLVHKQPHLKDYLKKNPNAAQTHRTGGY